MQDIGLFAWLGLFMACLGAIMLLAGLILEEHGMGHGKGPVMEWAGRLQMTSLLVMAMGGLFFIPKFVRVFA